MSTADIIREAEALLAANQIEAVKLVTAYQLHQPLEQPSPAWQDARDSAERKHGKSLVKYFST